MRLSAVWYLPSGAGAWGLLLSPGLVTSAADITLGIMYVSNESVIAQRSAAKN